MPVDDLYWNSIDFGSEEDESLQEPPSSKHYVDPWDLENYAYIRDHLDSVDLSSDPSSGEFTAEVNSTSFYYVPGDHQKESQGNYAAIEEVTGFETRRPRLDYVYSDSGLPRPNRGRFDSDFDEDSYDDSSLSYEAKDRRRAVPVSLSARDRSISFSYGEHDPYGTKQEIYSRPDEVVRDSTRSTCGSGIRESKKPRNFGLSNYGHLKIDYSYSWNNLDKYICN